MNPGNIPSELKKLDRWCLWRYTIVDGKRTKVPVGLDGRATDATKVEKGLKYTQAMAAFRKKDQTLFSGVGFILGAGIAGIDVDDCIDERGMNDLAKRISAQYRSTYAEVSPSGRGFKLLVRVEGQHRTGIDTGLTEIYDHGRFFTITGDVIPGHPKKLASMPAEFDASYAEFEGMKRAIVRDDARPASGALDRGLFISKVSLEQAARALNVLDPDCTNADWVRYGHALELDFSEAGYEVWDSWSARSAKVGNYPGHEKTREQWDRFKRNNDALTAGADPATSDSIIFDARATFEPNAAPYSGGGLRLINPLKHPVPVVNYIIGAPFYIPDLNEQMSFYGKPASFKSAILQMLSVYAAAGLDFDHKPVTPRVAVYAAEEAATLWDLNLFAWVQHFEATLPPAVAKRAVDNLNADYLMRFEFPIGGMNDAVAREMARLIIRRKAELNSELRGVLSLDPVAELLIGDESKAEDIRKYVAAGKLVQSITPMAVLHAHHTGHTNTDRERGSSAFPGKMFVRYEVNRPNMTEHFVDLTCKKHKAGREGPPTRWHVRPLQLVPTVLDEQGRPQSGVYVQAAGATPAVEDRASIAAQLDASRTVQMLQAYQDDPTMGGERLRKKLGIGYTVLKALADRAISAGLLQVGGGKDRAKLSITAEGRAHIQAAEEAFD